MLPEFFWITDEGKVLDCHGQWNHNNTAREEFERRGIEVDDTRSEADHAAAFELGWVRGSSEHDGLSLQWHGLMAERIRAKIMRALKRMPDIEYVRVAEAFYDGDAYGPVYLDPERDSRTEAMCSPSAVARLLRMVL